AGAAAGLACLFFAGAAAVCASENAFSACPTTTTPHHRSLRFIAVVLLFIIGSISTYKLAFPENTLLGSPKSGPACFNLVATVASLRRPWRLSFRCANQQQTSGLSSLVIGKYFYVLRDHEYCLVFDQLQIAEPFLRHFNVNRIAPLGNRFHFHERAGGIDVLDSCTEMASAVRLAINLEEMGANIDNMPCFPLVDISGAAVNPAMKQVHIAEEVVHKR